MHSKEEFKTRLREISDLVFSNAVRNLKSEIEQNPNPENWSNEFKLKFKLKVHDGFKLGQLRIIEEIISYQKILIESKLNLKQARTNRDKISESKIKSDIKEIETRLNMLSHVGDGIVWQLFGAQVYIIRRFYINESFKTLEESNIKHALQVASIINQKPENFALITDITNFIQIGDLIVLKDDQLGVLELKDGKVNNELMKLKTEYFKSDNIEEKLKEIGERLDPKKMDQFFRMLRQDLRMIQTIEVLSKDEGTDVKSGKRIKILTPKHTTETYTKKIFETINKLGESNWAYDVDFGGIIHIGVYRPASYQISQNALPLLLKDSKYKLIINYSTIIKNLSEPLFAKSFPPEIIHDLLFDDLRIILGFDLEKFFHDFEFFGVKTKVLSRKQTVKLKERDKLNAKNIFEINKQAFELIDEETSNSMILGGGIISKLIYDNISPLTIYMDLKEMFNTKNSS